MEHPGMESPGGGSSSGGTSSSQEGDEPESPGGLAPEEEDEEEGGGARPALGTPFAMMEDCLLKKIEISVSEAEKRTGRNAMNMQETYTAYLVETRAVESQTEGQCSPSDCLWRRYSEFELLRNYLLVNYPHLIVPPLPEKRAEFVWHKLSADNMDPDFVERRRIGLENFLLRVASHAVLCQDKMFTAFLTQEAGWKEMVNETGFLKADSRLKALSATFRVKNPDNFLPIPAFRLMSGASDNNKTAAIKSKTANKNTTILSRTSYRTYGLFKLLEAFSLLIFFCYENLIVEAKVLENAIFRRNCFYSFYNFTFFMAVL